jgi:hypothetical protein
MRAGPLDLVYKNGELRYVRLGRREIVRRLYVAVRDREWGTIPLRIEDEEIEADDQAFKITFRAIHQQGDVDFRWRGTVQGDPDGSIRFEMDGEAHADFLRNRIGICVLHPAVECAGAPAWVEHPDGAREAGAFPKEIAPHQPFFDMRALGHEVVPGLEAVLEFEGDVFEMEDQRNWTDASFKTYSTPLREPMPVQVRAGDRVRQAVSLFLEGMIPGELVEPTDGVPTLRIGAEPVARLPPIGLGCSVDGDLLTPDETPLLQALVPTHLRVDLDPTSPTWQRDFWRATMEARALGAGLEVGLHLSASGAESELEQVINEWVGLHPPVRRFMAFGHTALVRERIQEVANVPVAGGTTANFTELNRSRPDIAALDEVVYPINPQVHAFDDESMVETLEAQGETVRCARLFCGDRLIVVSPVTLHRRAADPRQSTLFAAAWTVGSIKYLSQAGVGGITYYETLGPRGVMPRGGAVYPLWHVLADVLQARGADVLPVDASHPLAVDALALRDGRRLRILVANMRPEPRRAVLGPVPGEALYQMLDEESLAQATRDPFAYRQQPATPLLADGQGWAELELGPHAVARIEVELA